MSCSLFRILRTREKAKVYDLDIHLPVCSFSNDYESLLPVSKCEIFHVFSTTSCSLLWPDNFQKLRKYDQFLIRFPPQFYSLFPPWAMMMQWNINDRPHNRRRGISTPLFPDDYASVLFFPNQISVHNAAKPEKQSRFHQWDYDCVTASAPFWEMKPSSQHRLIDAKCRKMRREHSCSVSNASAGAKCVSCVLGVFPLRSDTGGSGLPRLRLSDLRLVGMLMWNLRWRPGIETRWVFFFVCLFFPLFFPTPVPLG